MYPTGLEPASSDMNRSILPIELRVQKKGLEALRLQSHLEKNVASVIKPTYFYHTTSIFCVKLTKKRLTGS